VPGKRHRDRDRIRDRPARTGSPVNGFTAQGACQEKLKSRAKKTPVGDRGVRVIVVVANLVSVQRLGLWWIVVVVVTGLLVIVICSYSC
jgi:hypothetical protein